MYGDKCVTFRAVPKSSLKLFLRYGTVIGFCSEHTPFFTHAGSKIRRAFDRRTVNYHRCRGNDCQPRAVFSSCIRTECTSLSPPVNSCTWLTRSCLLKSNPTDVRRAPWERVLTRCADVGFRTWLRDGESHPDHRIGPDRDSPDGMVRNARQRSVPPNPRLTANPGENYCWTIKPSKGVAPKRRPPTSLTSSRGYPESGPGLQVRPPSLLWKTTPVDRLVARRLLDEPSYVMELKSLLGSPLRIRCQVRP